jgi:hypothetical protein
VTAIVNEQIKLIGVELATLEEIFERRQPE